MFLDPLGGLGSSLAPLLDVLQPLNWLNHSDFDNGHLLRAAGGWLWV